MTINCTRAESSVVCMYRGAKGSDFFSTKCVNDYQSYIAKITCVGLHSGTKTCDQSSGGGKNFSVSHQLEGDNAGSVDPSYGSRFSHPFQEEPRQMRLPQPYHYSKEQMILLREEVASLLGKGAVEVVDPTLSPGGFTQPSF